ncbi:unnamed protein product [Moneuplotes crassus]|uniref:Uncharacterized protein n=1 Tax=Euplotes crassus TaxID=5936 RepID=A0AAD1XQB0_EUPCR|nr:unnamed protein product [Moneuplotes crassus]
MIYYRPSEYVPSNRRKRAPSGEKKYKKKGGDYGSHQFLRNNMYIDDIEGVRSKRLFRGKKLAPAENKMPNSNNDQLIKPNIKFAPISRNMPQMPPKTNTMNDGIHVNVSSMFSNPTSRYSQLVNRNVPSRNSRITKDSGIQNYYNTNDIMNYKGNSLDCTDIEGASAGTGADGILKHRHIPLNPLEPQYDYPGDTELKGIPSRRQMMLLNTLQKNSSRNSSSMTNRRLLRSIRNSKEIKRKLQEVSNGEDIKNNKFMNRNRSLPVLHDPQYSRLNMNDVEFNDAIVNKHNGGNNLFLP